MNNYKKDDFAIDALNILNPGELRFSRSDSGYLNLSYNGNDFEQVTLTRLQPFYQHESNISVSFRNDEDEFIEIGIISELSALSAEQYELCRAYLEFRYYVPLITKVYTITDNRMGYLFIDAETTAGRKRIAVNDWWANFRLATSGMLTVTDSDGNKYYVPDMNALDKSSVRKLELFV